MPEIIIKEPRLNKFDVDYYADEAERCAISKFHYLAIENGDRELAIIAYNIAYSGSYEVLKENTDKLIDLIMKRCRNSK